MENVKFTKEDIISIDEFRDIIETLIRTKACSTITLKFRELIRKMDIKLGYNNTCQTCNSALMSSVSRIYAEYLKDKQYYLDMDRITESEKPVKEDAKKTNNKTKTRKGNH